MTRVPRVACIGECMIELREQPDGSLVRSFGGDTLNTAVYLARLGTLVDYVTVLGTDTFSEEMLAGWSAEGVGTGLVLRSPGALPGLYMIQTDDRGERRFSYWRDSAPVRRLFEHSELDRIEAGLARHSLIYLSGITLSLFGPEAGPGCSPCWTGCGKRARGSASTRISVRADGRAWASRARRSRRCCAAPTWCWRASKTMFCCTAATRRQQRSPGRTLGAPWRSWSSRSAPGCLLSDGAAIVPVATTPALTLVDTTAAGDSFAAGYLSARGRGLSPVESARLGHLLAGHVVLHRGAIIPKSSMPAMDVPTLDVPSLDVSAP